MDAPNIGADAPNLNISRGSAKYDAPLKDAQKWTN
jgi:hypothetical protein